MIQIPINKNKELQRLAEMALKQVLDDTTIDGVTIREWIDRISSGKYQPVKYGRWIRAETKGYPVKRSSIWYCSECGEKIKYNDTLGRYQKTKKTVSQVNPRCRKCGARMDEGEENNNEQTELPV